MKSGAWKAWPLVGALLLTILAAPLANGGRKPPPEAAAALDFAKSLYQQGDLHRAVSEAKRFLYFFPHHPRAAEAQELLGAAQSETVDFHGVMGRDGFTPWLDSLPDMDRYRLRVNASRWGVMEGLVRFYQNNLRTYKRDGQRCPAHPNCSNYCLQALRKHGSLMGTFIYIDRLWREVSFTGRPPFVYSHGRKLHYDPLVANDYWLKTEEKSWPD